jgi:hypothetical protein
VSEGGHHPWPFEGDALFSLRRLKFSPSALATLRLTSLAEIALCCVVVALVSVFAMLDQT